MSGYALPAPTHPPRSCSCVLPNDTGSGGGWHTRELGDHGCYELNRHTETTGSDGRQTIECNRGAGKHSCAESGQSCIYAGTIAAIEPCPKYRQACAVDAAQRNRDAAA